MPLKGPASRERDRKRKPARYAQARAIVDATKRDLGCRCGICGGVFHPCQLDFAHLDEHRSTKHPMLKLKAQSGGSMAQLARLSRPQFFAEVAKCRLLCANCHRLETWAGRHWEEP